MFGLPHLLFVGKGEPKKLLCPLGNMELIHVSFNESGNSRSRTYRGSCVKMWEPWRLRVEDRRSRRRYKILRVKRRPTPSAGSGNGLLNLAVTQDREVFPVHFLVAHATEEEGVVLM